MKIQAKIDRTLKAGKLKAIASVSLDGMFVVKGLKVMDGRKGLFVSMPQKEFSDRNGKKQYSNLFFALTNAAKMELQTAVLQAYQQSLDPNYRPPPSQSSGRGTDLEHIRHQQEFYPNAQYPEQFQRSHSPEPDYMDSEYAASLGRYGDMLPMGIR